MHEPVPSPPPGAMQRLSTQPLVPIGLLRAVCIVDAVRSTRKMGLIMNGLTDEVAHLITALLLLLAWMDPRRPLRHPAFALGALLGSVAIDLDHVPLYAGLPVAAGGRPFSHSSVTVLALLLSALLLPLQRHLLRGAAAGVCLHLLRDIATGPGVPLWWPINTINVRLGYWRYATAMMIATAVALTRRTTVRSARRGRR